jgi:hypothetical protein
VWYNTCMLNNNNNQSPILGAMRNQTNGARSVFARIMSTENITVLFDPKSKDAWFDTTTRTLNMPNWTGMTSEVYDLLLSHEVSHALHTPKEGWISLTSELAGDKASDQDKQVARQYINIVEDARIERLIKAKYPGLARDYRRGYEWLLDSGIFGKLTPQVIQEMTFIDRVNVHFKVGKHAGVSVPFTPEEQVIVDMIDNADTWEDVEKATRLVWDYATQNNEQSKAKVRAKGQPGDGDGKDGDETGEDGEGEGTQAPGGKEASDKLRRIAPAPKTVQQQEKFLERQQQQPTGWMCENDKPSVLPEFDMSQVVVPSSKIYSQIEQAMNTNCTMCGDWINHTRLEYMDFTNEANSTVDAMVKCFLLKKAATAHHRQQQSKTGTLDCNLLSTYKWNEDLFKHFTIKPNGKNHGFIVFLDWSGSMGGLILNVVKQMYILTSFFRRIGVPYDVYAFSSNQPIDEYVSDWNQYNHTASSVDYTNKYTTMQDSFITNRDKTVMNTQPFYLYHFASSSMKKVEHTKCMEQLFMLTYSMSGGAHSFRSPEFPYWLNLGDTPLDQALIAANTLVADFIRKYRVEIMNTVVISDGSTSGSPVYGVSRVVNPKNGASYSAKTNTTTNLLAKYLSDNTGTKTIMLFLDVAQAVTNVGVPGCLLVAADGKTPVGRFHNRGSTASESLATQWARENFVMAKAYDPTTDQFSDIGFDEVYAIRIPRKQADTDAFEGMDIENTGYSRLKSQFVKSLKTRIVSRSLVNRMVEGMAKHT